MSIGFLYLNSQPMKMEPKVRRSKPSKRTGSGKAKLEGIPKMLVVKYPNEKIVVTTTKTVNGTRVMALALIELGMHLTYSFSL